ncbi:MAG: CRISPR-associated endonuclease Cas2 [Desulfuromonadaceae bacterium]|nr:CRISPR-associated endonuclease Cas2 [Desulfuromonadaceae bacterium]
MNMIVAYDIAHPKRLSRIAKIMKDYGYRVQKSIFEVDVNERQFLIMKNRAEGVMMWSEDGVKYFPLCDRCADTLVSLGVCKVLPEDVDYLVL